MLSCNHQVTNNEKTAKIYIKPNEMKSRSLRTRIALFPEWETSLPNEWEIFPKQ